MSSRTERDPKYTNVRDAIIEITGKPIHPAMKPYPVDEPSRKEYLKDIRKAGEQSRQIANLTEKLREESDD